MALELFPYRIQSVTITNKTQGTDALKYFNIIMNIIKHLWGRGEENEMPQSSCHSSEATKVCSQNLVL